MGLPGADEAPGADGAPGPFNGYEIVNNICGPASTTCVVACPIGKKVLGGGCETNGALVACRPWMETTWKCEVNFTDLISVYAICANTE